MMLTRTPYSKLDYSQRDFMRPIGEQSFYFMSKAPETTKTYLKLITNAFDTYVWFFLAASVVSITGTFLIVDICYATWSKTSTKGVFHQSMY